MKSKLIDLSSAPVIKKVQCNRCYFSWYPKTPKLPKLCGRCKSAYWNSPRIRKLKKEGVK